MICCKNVVDITPLGVKSKHCQTLGDKIQILKYQGVKSKHQKLQG